MRQMRIVAVFVAVVATCVLVVTSASATLWLSSGASLTKATSAHWHDSYIDDHEGGTLGKAEIECTGLFIGTVGAGAQDKIELVESLTGEKDLMGGCKVLDGFCVGAIVHPVLLPWDTLLVLHVDGTTWDETLDWGYEILCPPFGIQVECKGNVSSKFLGNGANGAEFLFEEIGRAHV